MNSRLIGRHRRATCALALAVGASMALACATGPKDTLSGNWTGGEFTLSLRQSGSAVTGTLCSVVPVSGSVHGSEFDLVTDTGALTTHYAGAFVDPTTIILNQTGDGSAAAGGLTLYKGPSRLLAGCVLYQQ